MNSLITIGQEAFNWTWKASIQAGVLVLLILLLQRLLGRWLTPRLRYVLSLLVLCRLLLPLAPPSSLSIENLLTPNTRPVPPSVIATTLAVPVHAVPASNGAVAFSLGSALGLIWFCGLLAFFCIATWRYREWRWLIRSATMVSDVRLLKILDTARKAMGIRRPITLVAVPQLSSPAVFGIWRVRLLLPETALLRLSDSEWRLVFMHEMAHVRQNDALLNLLLMGVQFLHWFNPLVWIGLHRLRADRELVCDAMVLKRVEPSGRLGYAQVLLKLAETISLGPRAFPSALPVVGAGGEIKRRILMIKHYRESSRAAGVATIVLIFALGGLTFTRARERDGEPVAGQVGASPLIIFIDGQGGLRLGKEQRAITADQLKAELASAMNRNPEIKLTIKADKNAPSSQVIKVMEEAHDFKVSLAVSRKEEAQREDQRENLDELIERQLILHEFTTAGYNLPETVLDDLVDENIKTDFGDRATLIKTLEARGMTYEKFRQQIRERFIVAQLETNNKRTNAVAGIGISYLGPQLVKEDDIRARIHVQVGKPFTPAALDGDVRDLYATGLFYNVRVSTESTPAGMNLIYIVQCNPLLGKLKFTGNSKIGEAQLRKRLGSKVGEPFNERKLFQDSQAIQDMYEKAGYKGTVVKYGYDIESETGKATATFMIAERR